MINLTDEMTFILLVFGVVFALNLLPAFAPPTWMTLSFIGLTALIVHPVTIALVGATAAMLGRVTLAKFSRVIVRQRVLSDATRQNIDTIRRGINDRKGLTFSAFLAFAFSPLPSNYLFIAYGLTALPIVFLALPFFIGRLASYTFWITTASAVGDRLDLDPVESAPYFWAYFVLSQLLLVPIIYGFTRIDWDAALSKRKLQRFREERPR